MWEAQFGDFVNGAQTIIDEFISAGEVKWGQRSGVVLLLPHGYEGQGPDHSSARIERFLTLCAEDNMTVALPTTPANYFHLLRWADDLSEQHRPLVVFTPQGLPTPEGRHEPGRGLHVRRLRGRCWGTPTWRRTPRCGGRCCARARSSTTSQAARKKAGVDDVALVRVEQLYPLPVSDVADAVQAYGTSDVVWAQEEPANMGAWPRMALHLPEALGDGVRLRRVSRPASASPAVGSSQAHADRAAAPGRHRAGRLRRRRAVSERALRLYFTDRGIEELAARRGEEDFPVAWLTDRLRDFVDLHPEHESAVERLATWLARLDDDEDEPV